MPKPKQEEFRLYYLSYSEVVISKDEERINKDLILTRAFINDTELQRKSDTDREQKKAEDELNQKLEGASLDESSLSGDGVPLEHPSIFLSVDVRTAWDQLPKAFGNMKENNYRPPYNRSYSASEELATCGAARWTGGTDFSEYWTYVNEYIVLYSWAKIVEELDTVAGADMEMKALTFKPKPNFVCLIEQHNEANLTNVYATLLKSHPAYDKMANGEYNKEDQVAAYNVHFALVKEQAERDFGVFKRTSPAVRCKEFFARIESMGFSPDVRDDDIKKPRLSTPPSGTSTPPPSSSGEGSSAASTSVVKDENKTESRKRRFPIVYGDNELFCDLYSTIWDKLGDRGKNLLGSRHDKPQPSDSKDSGVDSAVSTSAEATSHEITAAPVDIKNITFRFDPEKEPHLLAANAHNYYKDDQEIRKYFYQRYRLFSKFDEGIIMDREGWFSVTPEKIAAHIAKRIVKKGMIVVDAFAGVGGNSIQFALQGARVIAIDLDPTRLKCAYQNAKIYGVADKIEFVCCDFFHFAAKWANKPEDHREVFDAVFLSPPWGGPSYMDAKEFRLDEGLTPDGFEIFYAARAMTPNIAYFLPKNTSVKQLMSLCDPKEKVEIEQSCLNKKVKLITAYYGKLVVENALR